MNSPLQNKTVFLDRDGVINVDHGYVYRTQDFDFIDGVFDACHTLQNQGYSLVVVTNQSGIARGYYTENDFIKLDDWMHRAFKAAGVNLLKTYYSPYLPTADVAEYRRDSQCRKPAPGMLLQAKAEFDIDMVSSIMVGDKLSDMQAAARAGLTEGVLITSEPKGLANLENHTEFSYQSFSSLAAFVAATF